MTAAIDTKVLLDLLGTDLARSLAAQRAIDLAASVGSVVICPVVYAELAAGFGQRSDLDRFLRDLTIQRQAFADDAIWQAG